MILNAYSLLDVKAGAFHPPFFMHHDSQAIRAVTEVGRDLSTTVGRYPSDFALCQVGQFDDAAGAFLPGQVRNLGLVAGFLPAPTAMPLFEGGDQVARAQQLAKSNGAMAPGFDPNGEVM